MLGSRMRSGSTFAAVALALGVAVAAAARIPLEPAAAAVGRVRDPAWLPRGDQLRVAALGHRLVLADLYWLKLVQYVGENFMAGVDEKHWEALFPLADLVTDLDPRHGYAYQITGSNLAGLAGRYAEADRILVKGMKALPDRWALYFVQATNKFLYEGDFAAAAAYARKAAEVGHRPHLALLAANLSLVANRDDEYAAAEQFLLESLRQVDTPELRSELEQRLVKVRTYQVLSVLERAAAGLEQAGRPPRTIHELARAAGFSGVPADPSGGTFVWDPAKREVRSTALGLRKPTRIDKP